MQFQSTDPQGVAVRAVDDATYAVAVTKSGYSGVTTSLIVDGDEFASILLDAVITVAPSPPNTATGVMLLTRHGVAVQGTEVSAQLIAGTGTSGTGQVNPVWTQTSDQDGLVQFSGLAWGCCYRFWLGCRTDESVEMDVPSLEQVNLPNLIDGWGYLHHPSLEIIVWRSETVSEVLLLWQGEVVDEA